MFLVCQRLFGKFFLNQVVKRERVDYLINLLRHEYGHYVQEQSLGTIKYLFGIALPSISVNCRNMFFKDISNSEYYSMPWEVTADLFGGVSRSYSYQSGAETRGLLYYMHLKGR